MEANRVLRIDRLEDAQGPPYTHPWLLGVAELLSAGGSAVALADDAGHLLAMSRRLEVTIGALPDSVRRQWLTDLGQSIRRLQSDAGAVEWQELVKPWHTRFTAVSFPSTGHTVVRIELSRNSCLPAQLRQVLSRREAEVATELLEGHSSRIIAEHLGVTVHTVRRMTERVFKKMGVHSRAELTLRALGVSNRARLRVSNAPTAASRGTE
jgi:DNA-binding CsgD family transcriptional regulator